MNHTQTLNDAQKHNLEVEFWFLLGQDNVFLDFLIFSSYLKHLVLQTAKNKTKQKNLCVVFVDSKTSACLLRYFSFEG